MVYGVDSGVGWRVSYCSRAITCSPVSMSTLIFSDDEEKATGSFKPGVGNLWPMGQIWPITSLGW